MSEAYGEYWDNYFNFSGRMSRKKFWLNVLIYYIIYFSLTILANVYIEENLGDFFSVSLIGYWIVTIVPNISMIVRRLHDTNQSGACIFIGLVPIIGPIIVLIFLAMPSVNENNNYKDNEDARISETSDIYYNAQKIDEISKENENDNDNFYWFIAIWVIIILLIFIILAGTAAGIYNN